MPDMKTVMGFDFGTRKTGVAVGQTITRTATALALVTMKKGIPVWAEIEQLIDTWKPSVLVVGRPLNMDGTSQPLTEAAENFAKALEEKTHLPVYQIDERLSTVEARARIFEKGGYRELSRMKVDAFAAQIILHDWLNQLS